MPEPQSKARWGCVGGLEEQRRERASVHWGLGKSWKNKNIRS